MPSLNPTNQQTVPPTHQDFRWIHGSGQQERFAAFIELTRDISAGVHTCLQIIYSSELVREINETTDLEQISAPAIGATDSDALLRLVLAATGMLRKEADEHIAALNEE